jgi:hypothetical protein
MINKRNFTAIVLGLFFTGVARMHAFKYVMGNDNHAQPNTPQLAQWASFTDPIAADVWPLFLPF